MEGKGKERKTGIDRSKNQTNAQVWNMEAGKSTKLTWKTAAKMACLKCTKMHLI